MDKINKENIGVVIFANILSMIIVAFNIKWIETHNYTILNTIIRAISICIFLFLEKLVVSTGSEKVSVASFMVYFGFFIIAFLCISDVFRIVEIAIIWPIEFIMNVLFSWL